MNPIEDPELQGVWQALDELEPVPRVSGNFEARMWARLEAERSVTPGWLVRLSKGFDWLHIPVFAALLVCLGLFLSTDEPASPLALTRPVSSAQQHHLKHDFPVQTEDLLRWVITLRS